MIRQADKLVFRLSALITANWCLKLTIKEFLRDDIKIFMLKILRYYFRIVP